VQSGLNPKYFPFPHPASNTRDPEGKEFKKVATFGHLANLVELK
jgi:hypothetical protein